MIRIEKYKNTSNWAVWVDEKLVAVVCYKKGAQAIKDLITQRKKSRQSCPPGKNRLNRRLKKNHSIYFNRK
jgi:hypothetical protein